MNRRRCISVLGALSFQDGMTNLEKAKEIIKEHYVPCGIYDSRNVVGDPMCTIYQYNGLQIDVCYYYEYFEVFGLPDEEFAELKKYYETLGR